MKYKVYYLSSRDFSKNPDYADYKILLEEINDQKSSFETKAEAKEFAESICSKNVEVAILEVYGG